MPVERLDQTCETTSPEETLLLGRSLGERLLPGNVVALIGDLGAGKTHLIQGICLGLDVKEFVTSPTFTLINEYEGRVPVAHFDLYRLEDPEAVLDLGYDDYLDGAGVCLIEWADKFPELLPVHRIEIQIELIDEVCRRIQITDSR